MGGVVPPRAAYRQRQRHCPTPRCSRLMTSLRRGVPATSAPRPPLAESSNRAVMPQDSTGRLNFAPRTRGSFSNVLFPGGAFKGSSQKNIFGTKPIGPLGEYLATGAIENPDLRIIEIPTQLRG